MRGATGPFHILVNGASTVKVESNELRPKGSVATSVR